MNLISNGGQMVCSNIYNVITSHLYFLVVWHKKTLKKTNFCAFYATFIWSEAAVQLNHSIATSDKYRNSEIVTAGLKFQFQHPQPQAPSQPKTIICAGNIAPDMLAMCQENLLRNQHFIKRFKITLIFIEYATIK